MAAAGAGATQRSHACILTEAPTRCRHPPAPVQTAQWGEQALEFSYEGGTPRALHIELYGQLPAAADLVGAGDLDLHEASCGGLCSWALQLGLRQGHASGRS